MKHMTLGQLKEEFDISSTTQKIEEVKEYYKQQLLDSQRYGHNWQAYPRDIESAVILFLNNYTTRNIWEKRSKKTYDAWLEDVKLIHKNIHDIHNMFGVFEIAGKNHRVDFSSVYDSERSHLPTPIRQVTYKRTAYRSVKYNDNLFNHMDRQTKSFEKNYFPSLLADWFIIEWEKENGSLFNRYHDLPEIDPRIGDNFAYAKNASNAAKIAEADILEEQLLASNIEFSPYELAYLKKNLEFHEGKDTLFGLGEILEYLEDAARIEKGLRYFNGKRWFAASIMISSLPKIQQANTQAKLVTDTWDITYIPYKYVQSIPNMLQRNQDAFTEILTYCKKNIKETLALWAPKLQTIEDLQQFEKMIESTYNTYNV